MSNLMSRRKLLALGAGVAALPVLAACGAAATPTAAPAATAKPAAAATTAPAAAATTAPATAPTTAPAAAATTAPAAAATTAPAAKPTAAAAQPTAAAAASTSAGASAIDGVDIKGKNVEVVYWHNRTQKDQDLLQSMFDEFNKSNEYGVKARAEIGGASYNDVYNKVNAAIAAGKPPEMTVAYQNQAAFYRGQNAIVDLTPYIESKKYGLSEADLKDYFKTFIDSDANPQFKGERLGFPTQRSMEVMFANTDSLNKAGLNEIPKDWKTWEDVGPKVSDAAKNKYLWTLRHDASNFASLIFSRGGRVLSEDGSAYVFNSQAGVDSLALIQRLFKNKVAVEVPTSERFGEQNRFGNGEITFVIASSSGMPFYQEAVGKGGKFKWDIALLPNTGKPAVNLYGASISVYKTTPEKQVASWLAIKFLGEKPQTTKWAVATGYLPVRQSAKDEVIKAYKDNPAWGSAADSYAKMFDWAQYAMVESPVAGYDPVRDIIDKEVLSRAVTDWTSDPKKILDDAVAKSNKILAENAPKK